MLDVAQVEHHHHYPLQSHPQLTFVVDALLRKAKHHVILLSDESSILHFYFVNAITQQLKDYGTLAQCFFIKEAHEIEKLLHVTSNKTMRLIVLSSEVWQQQQKFLHSLENNLDNRFIIFSKQSLAENENYLSLTLKPIAERDQKLILQIESQLLAQYYHVQISELLAQKAYQLCERYYGIKAFEYALMLIDTCAAKSKEESIVTDSILETTLSNWLNIPTDYINFTKLKMANLVKQLQQRIFGQDVAISLISQSLQKTQTRLSSAYGPLCSWLFTGNTHSGKQTTIKTIVELLFKQFDVLFIGLNVENLDSLMEMKCQRYSDKKLLSLIEVLQQTPYAIIYIENIEKTPSPILSQLFEILTTGEIKLGQQICRFQQTMLVLSTTITSQKIAQAIQTEPRETDLMQLISHYHHEVTHLNATEVVQLAYAECQKHIPDNILKNVNVIPFIPLDKIAKEKIICFKLNILSAQVQQRYKVELNIAPEIVHYIQQELANYSVETLFQDIYFCVEQTIFSAANQMAQIKQLFLHLNETGDAFRCEVKALSVI